MENKTSDGSIETKRVILDDDSKNIFKNTNYLSLWDSKEIEISNGSIIPIQRDKISWKKVKSIIESK
ncbi:hypothetical protein ES705_41699 [subsurface metagenome]